MLIMVEKELFACEICFEAESSSLDENLDAEGEQNIEIKANS